MPVFVFNFHIFAWMIQSRNEIDLILGRILQPYVSPINFIAEEDEVPRRQPKRDAVNIEIHRKKSVISSKSKKSIRKKVQRPKL